MTTNRVLLGAPESSDDTPLVDQKSHRGAGQPGLREHVQVGALDLVRCDGDLSGLHADPLMVGVYFVRHASVVDPRTGGTIALRDGLMVVPARRLPRPLFNGEGRVDGIKLAKRVAESFSPHALSSVQVYTRASRLELAARQFLTAMTDTPVWRNESPIEEYASQQILTELAGSIILNRSTVPEGTVSASSVLRARAVSIISQRCAEADFRPESVAKAVQASLRSLQGAFAEEGNSIAAEIRRQRGRMARNLLTDSRYDILSVRQVAEQTGFGNAGALRRALVDLYGCGPRELRELHRN